MTRHYLDLLRQLKHVLCSNWTGSEPTDHISISEYGVLFYFWQLIE